MSLSVTTIQQHLGSPKLVLWIIIKYQSQLCKSMHTWSSHNQICHFSCLLMYPLLYLLKNKIRKFANFHHCIKKQSALSEFPKLSPCSRCVQSLMILNVRGPFYVFSTFLSTIILQSPRLFQPQVFQSINQREICRAPLYETSRSANSSQWYARSKSTLLSRFLNVLVSVMWWRSEGRVFQAAGPQ